MPVTRRDFVRTFFVASQAALVNRLIPGTLRAEEPAAKTLNFAVIGDWGRKGRTDQAEVAAQMAIACKRDAASFVVSVGDNFYEVGVKDVADPQFNESFQNVYTGESLKIPWYVIHGNHDYCGNCEAQIEYSKVNPRWKMPARYYSKVYEIDAATKIECFYLDTNPFIKAYEHHALIGPNIANQNTAAQVQWLDQALSASTARWKFVIGHHPIYSSGLAHGNTPELIERVLPFLEQHKVHAYFAGHDHDLEYLKVGDLNLIISGAGSEHRPIKSPDTSPFSRAVSGFVMASVSADNLRIQFIDNKGSLLYTANSAHVG